MSSRYLVDNQDKRHEVVITEDGDGYRVVIDGESFTASVRDITGNPTRSLLIDGRSYEIATMSSRDGTDVYVSGDVFRVRVTDELWARAEGGASVADAGREAVLSPMPGAVVSIEVELGQVVRAGEVVAVVEAMKMQNDLTAEHGGKVTEIRAAAGDVVEQDAVLVVMEAETK